MKKHQKMTGLTLARIKKDLTQGELAKRCGLSISAISGYERGTYSPRGATLAKLATVLNCSVDDLLQ